LYFTDPFKNVIIGKRGPKEQTARAFFYLAPDRKQLVRVVSELKQPNGLIGTPDGKMLYVADIARHKTFRL